MLLHAREELQCCCTYGRSCSAAARTGGAAVLLHARPYTRATLYPSIGQLAHDVLVQVPLEAAAAQRTGALKIWRRRQPPATCGR